MRRGKSAISGHSLGLQASVPFSSAETPPTHSHVRKLPSSSANTLETEQFEKTEENSMKKLPNVNNLLQSANAVEI